MDHQNLSLSRGLAGPKIVDFSGRLLPQNQLKKWGTSPPTFSNGFCGRRGLCRALPAPGDRDKFWSSQVLQATQTFDKLCPVRALLQKE